MTDALPDIDRALTFDERMAVAVEWSDYRKEYGVSAEGMTTAHLAFVAGWRARHLHGYTPENTIPYETDEGVVVAVDLDGTVHRAHPQPTVQDHTDRSPNA